MIKIKITEKVDHYSIRIGGHAGAGARGEDLICAAVSTLGFTAAEVLSRFEADGDINDLNIDFEAGKMDIDFRMQEKNIAVRGALSAIKCGFEMLSEKFPDNITLIYSPRAV